jgi:hypothetical protein
MFCLPIQNYSKDELRCSSILTDKYNFLTTTYEGFDLKDFGMAPVAFLKKLLKYVVYSNPRL